MCILRIIRVRMKQVTVILINTIAWHNKTGARTWSRQKAVSFLNFADNVIFSSNNFYTLELLQVIYTWDHDLLA